MILAGDIGGTNTRLALFREESGRLLLAEEQIFPSRQHASLEEIVGLYLKSRPQTVEAACFGIAGPVINGRATTANLPWIVDAAELSRRASIPSVWIINDLQAHAYGISDLPAKSLLTLNEGKLTAGNRALIAAGTGLGEAGMFWDGSEHHAFAGEGGHADFAPANELEAALHAFLMKKFGHVSCERVLSGPGIKNIYDFLVAAGIQEEPEWLRDQLAQAFDPVVVISDHALNTTAPICQCALDIFVSAYGAEAGNMALRLMAVGGVYVSGGIAGKIIPLLKKPAFMKAFVDKGRMEGLLNAVPVKVIVNDHIGLLGAARYALRSSRGNLKPAYSQA
ncbi:MAG TPA: glucokinase [Candidatus Angelobacter sp.]|nr:glucokinase [Candidatus Angelobacter sp.]